MKPGLARALALAFAGVAIYLVVLSAHAARVPLEAALAAAVLCVLSLTLLWRVPVAAAVVNVLGVVAALVLGHWPGNAVAPVATNAVASGGAEGAALASVVGGVANRPGASPGAQLALVSNGVRYEIYPGVFRGAAATLADGAGNDYDRALLLHDLLAASHAGAVRYAFCTLAPQQTDASVTAARSVYVAPAIGANAQALAQRARDRAMRDGYTRIATFWKAAAAQEREQTNELASDFQKANVRLVPPKGADLRPIAADHVWVQLQRGAQWIDFDPSVAHANPGSAVCSASKTSDALPDAAFDTVSVTLQLESRDGDRENTATVASQTWRTADLATTPLMFAFAESSGLHSPAPQPTGMRSYTPLLVAGMQTIAATPITVPTPVPGGLLKTASRIASQGASQAVTAFGTAPLATPSAAPSPAGPIPVALRLNVAVAAPNVSGVTVDHVIFDRVSAADRAAGHAATATIAPISLLPFGTVLNVAVNLGTGVVGAGGYEHFDRNSTDPASVNRGLGEMHRAYYTLRRAAFAELGAPAPPVVSVRPGISFLGFAPYPAGPAQFGLMMDRAGEGGMPDGGDGPSSLAWGVASLYGERLAVGSSAMQTPGLNLDQLPFDDSIEMFYIARHTNVAPVLVRSTADVAALSASADAKARLSARVADGSSAVVPSSQISYGGSIDDGWWIVAADGSVTDEMQSGLHPDLGEEGEQEEEAAEQAPQEAKEGGKSRCAVWVTGAMFIVAFGAGGVAAGEEGAEEFEKAQEVMHALDKEKEIEEIVETAEQCSEGSGKLPPGATSPPIPPPPIKP